MKLQVGCGDHKVAPAMYKRSEWVNVDIITVPGVNVKASGATLPFKDDVFEEVHCVHTLEHVTRDLYEPMLAEMYRVLKPGACLYVETPDFHGTVKRLMEAFTACDTRAIHVWTTSVYGKNERHGMAHHWGFHEALMLEEFRALGFAEVDRLVERKDMISPHWRQEPVLLVRGTK
jgi:predicted SAM-dependent methyltransferase